MSFPRPWLASILGEKLTQVSNDCFCFSPAAATASVLHLGKGKAVQVVALHPTCPGYLTTTISDGTHSLQARIYSQDPTEPTRGSIVGIRNYNLVGLRVTLSSHSLTLYPILDPTSKRADRLVLEIVDFKVLGCENPDKFGKPANLLKADNISASLGQLRARIMQDADTHNGPRSQPTSPFHTQRQIPSSAAFSSQDHATQAQLATQVAMPINMPPPLPNGSKMPSFVPSRKSDLLGVLMRKAPLIEAPQKFEANSEVGQGISTSRSNLKPTVQNPPILAQIPADDVLQSASKLDSMVNIRQSQSAQISRSSNEENARLVSDNATHAPAKLGLQSDDGEKENSQEKTNTIVSNGNKKEKRHVSSARVNISDTVPTAENEKPAVEMVKVTNRTMVLPFEDPFNAGGNPFVGRKRIQRAYVNIPRDQQELLDRDDAWHPSCTSSTNAYATIPIKVREELIAFSAQPPKADLDLNVGGDEEERGSDSESHDSFHSIQENNGGGPSPTIKHASPQSRKSADNPEDMVSEVAEDWTPSPEAHKHHTLATLGIPPPTFGSLHPTSTEDSTTNIETALPSELPSHQPTEIRPSPLYIPRLLMVDFPSSSGLGSEMEVDELHAEGEEFVGNETRILHAPDTSQEVPSTAVQRASLVQVEKSPFNNTSTDEKGRLRSAGPEVLLARREASEGRVSSDVIVPATWKDLSQQSKTSKLNITDNLVVARHSDHDGLSIECSAPRVTGGEEITLAPQNEASACLFDEQQAFERESSQVTDTNIPSSPPVMEAEYSFSRNRSDQPFDAPSHRYNRPSDRNGKLSPKRPPALTVQTLTGPADSRGGTEVLSSPELPPPLAQQLSRASSAAASVATATVDKLSRRKSVAAIIKEKDTSKDTREMVRGRRRQFTQSISGTDLQSTHSSPSKSHDAQSEGRLTIKSAQPEPPVKESPAEEPSTPIRYIPTQPEASSPKQPRSIENTINAVELPTVEPQSRVSQTSRSPPHRQIDTYIGSASKAETSQNNSPVLETIIANSLSTSDFYEKFLAAYPDYCGSRNNFTWALVYIEWLRKGGQLLHRSLCDDFIRVISFDFINYVKRCQGKPKTGWQYYDENVLRQEYSKQIITPENLQQALSTLDQTRIQKSRAAFEQPHKSIASQSQESMMIACTQIAAVSASQEQIGKQADISPQARSQHEEEPVSHAESRPARPISTSNSTPVSSTAKASRGLPWVGNSMSAKNVISASLGGTDVQRKSPTRPLCVPEKSASRALLKSKHFSILGTNSIPSPDYVDLVEETTPPRRPIPRVASPILGSQVAPTPENKWRKSIENFHREKEQAKRDSLQNKGEQISPKRKLHEPDNIHPPPKRSRTEPQQDQTPTSFQPQKPPPSASSTKVPSPTFHTPQILKSPSIPTSTMDSASKVAGWLNQKLESKRKSITFEEFILKEKESGRSASRASTPAIHTGKRFCTKPREGFAGDGRDGTPMRSMTGESKRRFCTKPKGGEELREPETQAWDYEG